MRRARLGDNYIERGMAGGVIDQLEMVQISDKSAKLGAFQGGNRRTGRSMFRYSDLPAAVLVRPADLLKFSADALEALESREVHEVPGSGMGPAVLGIGHPWAGEQGSPIQPVSNYHHDLSVTLFASGGLAPTMTARRVRGWDQFCRPPDIADRPT